MTSMQETSAIEAENTWGANHTEIQQALENGPREGGPLKDL